MTKHEADLRAALEAARECIASAQRVADSYRVERDAAEAERDQARASIKQAAFTRVALQNERDHARFMATGWRRLATERAEFLRTDAHEIIASARAHAVRWKSLAKSLRLSAHQARGVAMGFQHFLDQLEGTVAGAKPGTMAYDLWMMLRNRPSKRVN